MNLHLYPAAALTQTNQPEGKLLAESVDSPDSPDHEFSEYVPSARKKYTSETCSSLLGRAFIVLYWQ